MAKLMNQTIVKVVLFLLITTLPAMLQAKKYAKGMVFVDSNNNGIFDKGEKGVDGVAVSDQYNVTYTDAQGRFKLRLTKAAKNATTIIFISKPAGFSVPMDKNNVPRFYYIHQPKGSPTGLKYEGIQPTGKLPKKLWFPLKEEKETNEFDVIVMGDPQTKTSEELDYFRDNVVNKLTDSKDRFYLALGDILYDDLDLFERMNNITGSIGKPIYAVPGNHDLNYKAVDNTHSTESFKRVYGPDYYSFNYGNVHFVVLNTVKYKGWNKEKNKKGKYTGYVHERQLKWLSNDLEKVPQDHLIVLSMHIPISSTVSNPPQTFILNSTELFKVLENRKHLLALAGHRHFIDYMEFTDKDGWQSETKFPMLIAGAGCGAWWGGPKDPKGIPHAYGPDGAPNGFFRFHFSNNEYSFGFHPARALDHEQFRINSPMGILKQNELNQQRINVNVFAGTPDTRVTFQIDDGDSKPLIHKMMKDPFFDGLVKENQESYIDGVRALPTSHIWEAPMPTNLAPGLHRLNIFVKDNFGNTFKASRLLEVRK